MRLVKKLFELIMRYQHNDPTWVCNRFVGTGVRPFSSHALVWSPVLQVFQ